MLRDGQRKKGKSKKLQFRWKGPYTVIQHQIIDDECGHQIKNYIIKPDIGSKTKLVHASRLKTTLVPKRSIERNMTQIANEVFDAVLAPKNEALEVSNAPEDQVSNEVAIENRNENELEWDNENGNLITSEDYLFDVAPVLQDFSDSFNHDLDNLSNESANDILKSFDESAQYEPNYYYQQVMSKNNDQRSPYEFRTRKRVRYN
jgi:hypothetical protein